MFGFIKGCFCTGLAFLSTLTSVNLLSAAPLNAVPLSCVSISNVKQEHKLLKLMGMTLYFFLIVLKQINAALVVTISIIHAQNCVVLML